MIHPKQPLNVSDRYALGDDELLIITNYGEYCIMVDEFDSFNEDMAVHYGEMGKTFEILMVVDCYNHKWMGDAIWHRFQKGECTQ